MILADTKFEFGTDAAGNLFLIDEVLTPDSSRYWPADRYAPDQSPPSYDKQFVRDHLLALKADASGMIPARVREGCALLLETPLPGGELVALRTAHADERVLEAVRDVIAHAYAVVKRSGEPG